MRKPIRWAGLAASALLLSLMPRSSLLPFFQRHLASTPGDDIQERLARLAPFAIGDEPITTGNELRLLVDGPEYFPRMLEAIRAARSSVDYIVFLWCDDDAGLAAAQAMADAARRGVRVHVVIDAWSRSKAAQSLAILQAAGIEPVTFNPLSLNLFMIERRIHEKVMVVDGAAAYVGGSNMCDEYMTGKSRKLWHDLMFQIKGPAAARVKLRVDDTYAWMTKSEFKASDRDADLSRLKEITRVINPDSPDESVPVIGAPQGRLPEVQATGDSLAVLQYQQGYWRPQDGQKFRNLFSGLMDKARNDVVMYAPYLMPTPELIAAMKRARARGVRVMIFTNSAATNDMGASYVSVALSYYKQLLSEGVEIWEDQDTTVHAKMLLVDDWAVTIGSNNMNLRSLNRNGEANLLTDDREAVSRAWAMVRKDQSGEFKPVTMKDFLERLKDPNAVYLMKSTGKIKSIL
jgi:cardiolipin synthase